MTLGKCPLGIFCSRGTPPNTFEPTSPESIITWNSERWRSVPHDISEVEKVSDVAPVDAAAVTW